MNSKSYYEVLEVPETASQDEIKKSFRKLALKYHPDKHSGDSEAEAIFKEINEAYQTLSNPEKRESYDASRRPTDPEDEMFGFFRNSFRVPTQEEIIASFARKFQINGLVTLSLQEAIEGCQKVVPVTMVEIKLNEEKKIVQTKKTGTITQHFPPGLWNGILQVEAELDGKKHLLNIQINLDIPSGMSISPNGDVIQQLVITYPQSILGGVVEVKNLYGKPEKLRIPEHTMPGMILSVKNHGLPQSPQKTERGSLLFSVVVDIPESVDDETKNILEQLQKKLEQQNLKGAS